jgi:RNA polymerase sigma factor (sigma-70 family)
LEKSFALDESLMVAGLKSRDQLIFSKMYEKYAPAFLGFIYKMLNDNELANDILQDVFINIWKNIDQYDAAKGRFYTWATNIVRNTTINFLRSKYYISSTKIQNLENFVNNDWTSSESRVEDYIGMDKMILKMEDKHQEVIHLVYYLGYTQQEAAEKLDLPLGTVKTRVRAALQHLRKLLAH